MQELVSILMSTFNENIRELEQSVSSILNQTYKNIEFVIINDNPVNTELESFLKSIIDRRVIVLRNEKNIGLANSLNKAISYANGKYIARMDADDISISNRIEMQVTYLNENKLDLVGSWINYMDEAGKKVSIAKFPIRQRYIEFFLKWGTCMPHPTWLGKKTVFEKLKYRDIPLCEDYDFICRCINEKYRLGNVNQVLLNYRVRDASISNSNREMQYIIRNFLSRNEIIGIEKVHAFLDSKLFKKELDMYKRYQQDKMMLKKNNYFCFIKVITNKYAYKKLCEKIAIKLRALIID